MAFLNNLMKGLASGTGGLGAFARGYNAVLDNDAYTRGVKQINEGNWQEGVNTIAERNPEVALGLAQYKQKQDDMTKMQQMENEARNTITPYQREYLDYLKSKGASSDGLGGFGKTTAGLALSIAQNPDNYSPEMVNWAKNQLLANSVDYATQKAYETETAKGKAQLEYKPELSRETAYQSGLGKSQAEREKEAGDIERSYPALEDMTNKLINLADKATYTVAGQTRDWILRQAGLPMSEGGVAREEYKQTVANELIPQLKKMFGGQLSDAEREALLGTLGDVNLSPEEKKSAIRSFIETKKRQLKYNTRTEPQQTDIIDASEYFK